MNAEKSEWGLHWFRRDLRIVGNEALRSNWKRTSGRTLGIFCFDSQFLSRPDFSHNRFAFFIKTLAALKEDLIQKGGDLLVVDCQPHTAFSELIKFVRQRGYRDPSLVTWNRDHEPFARSRDAKIKELLSSLGIEHQNERDHLLFEPHEIVKGNDPQDFYQVYSPYARKWFEKLNSPEGLARIPAVSKLHSYFENMGEKSSLFQLNWDTFTRDSDFPFQDSLAVFEKENNKHVTVTIPEGGFHAAFSQLIKFKKRIDAYKDRRDFPSEQGTSQLSIYLKNGSITVPQIISVLGLEQKSWKEKSGPAHFLKELAWREFYYSILYHRPDVEQKSFLPQYENLIWENRQDYFEKWKNGTTGFPIVDAGMRELAQTGWMHNRVRMIVASFLTKDLLIDWRWGENFFMKTLLDGDLAPNNGGWQWAASTGCDPQPYFRIFNPWLQSVKFDPDGTYIKKFVKELEHVSADDLHDAEADRSRWGYPAPIVDHSVQREKALAMYKRN